jgi:hypothetical protein
MKRQPRKVAPGKALATTDQELDMLALITPTDIDEAKADGRRNMTRRGRALLEARKAEGDNAVPLGS